MTRKARKSLKKLQRKGCKKLLMLREVRITTISRERGKTTQCNLEKRRSKHILLSIYTLEYINNILNDRDEMFKQKRATGQGNNIPLGVGNNGQQMREV